MQASSVKKITTGLNRYANLLALIESFGGLACLIFFVAKLGVSVVESRLREGELIHRFYQVERANKGEDVSSTDSPNNSNDNENKKDSKRNLSKPKIDPELPLQERIGKFAQSVTVDSQLNAQDLRTLKQVLNQRQNFTPKFENWAFSICCSFLKPQRRSDQHFKKGRRKIALDLDLRTYIKSVRDQKIL
jgi:hypothetical protein